MFQCLCKIWISYDFIWAFSASLNSLIITAFLLGQNWLSGRNFDFWKYRPEKKLQKLFSIFPEISSLDGFFWRLKKKFEFLQLNWDSRFLQAAALKPLSKMTRDITFYLREKILSKSRINSYWYVDRYIVKFRK